MKHFFHDVAQFIFFIIAMTALGTVFVGYAIYTLFYYLFNKLNESFR
jgi:hypothetical protein